MVDPHATETVSAEGTLRALLEDLFDTCYAAGQQNVKGWQGEELRLMKHARECETRIITLFSEVRS